MKYVSGVSCTIAFVLPDLIIILGKQYLTFYFFSPNSEIVHYFKKDVCVCYYASNPRK